MTGAIELTFGLLWVFTSVLLIGALAKIFILERRFRMATKYEDYWEKK